MKKWWAKASKVDRFMVCLAVIVAIVFIAGAAMMINHYVSAPTPIIVLDAAGEPVEFYVGAHNPLLWPAQEEFHMLRFDRIGEAENLQWVFKHRDDAIRVTMRGDEFENRYGRLAAIGDQMNGLFAEYLMLRELGLPEEDPEVQERVTEYRRGWEEYWGIARTIGRPPVTAAHRGI